MAPDSPGLVQVKAGRDGGSRLGLASQTPALRQTGALLRAATLALTWSSVIIPHRPTTTAANMVLGRKFVIITSVACFGLQN